MKILISACLLGINTRYDSGSSFNEKVVELCKNYTIIPICPEQLGGLTTPRLPTELIQGGGKEVLMGKASAVNSEGKDVTPEFIRGAKETLNIAQLFNCKCAILKAKSPSCGLNRIYDGTFTKTLKEGNGVTTQLLIENGIRVFNENDDFLSYLK